MAHTSIQASTPAYFIWRFSPRLAWSLELAEKTINYLNIREIDKSSDLGPNSRFRIGLMRRPALKDAEGAQKIAHTLASAAVRLNPLVLNLEQINRVSSDCTLLLQTVTNFIE